MNRGKKVLIVATMDTKAAEAIFVKECLEKAGVGTVIMDAGIMGTCDQKVEISREQVAKAAGTTLDNIKKMGHEGRALGEMIKGATKLGKELVEQGKVHGILGIGGSMGTTLGTSVMRALPIGFPKVMISTMASRNTRPFVGTKDIMMLHSVCDLSGINRITEMVLRNGAMAVSGMVLFHKESMDTEKPLALISTLGTTEACAVRTRKALEDKGYEVVIFHTVGAGGEAMDEFIKEEGADLVIELSLHELMDHLFGGDYDAGPERGRAGIRRGIPTILIPGNTDFLVTGPLSLAEKNFLNRKVHSHNAAITAVRSSQNELKRVGQIVGNICNEAKGPVAILIPEKGFSAFDHINGPLYDPEGPKFFESGVMETIKNKDIVVKVSCHINDELFSEAVIQILDSMIKSN